MIRRAKQQTKRRRSVRAQTHYEFFVYGTLRTLAKALDLTQYESRASL